jgi:hypothetical protein
MTRALVAAALVLLLAASCGPEEPPKPPGVPKTSVIAKPANDAAERASIANFGHGATVVWRSGEALLETSALATIDGDPTSYWTNLPNDFPQALTIALAAPARIEQVGVRAFDKAVNDPKETVFEVSTDGRTFRPLATLRVKPAGDPQWLDVQPTDAAFLRVTMPEPSVAGGHAALASILVRGRELAPARSGDIVGCWTVNGRPTVFSSETTGTMQYEQSQLHFKGGRSGRIYRYEWIRGPEFGYAAFAVSPDGKHLNGIQWHEEIVPLFVGDHWFGVECAGHAGALTAAARPPHSIVADEFLKRTGRHSLYSLDADELQWLARQLRQHPNARLVAHEFREATPAANRARAQRALDSLVQALHNAGVEPRGVTLVAAGSDNARQIPGSEAARELYSTVDLEVGR